MDYVMRLVYETEGVRGADERGWNGPEAKRAEEERQRQEYLEYMRSQESYYEEQHI